MRIIRCFSILSPESRIPSRLWENLSFGLTSAWQVLTLPKPDVIYANTWPLIATSLLLIVARLRHIPLVISVQDIYPEALIVQGRIQKNSILTRMMRWVDGIIARNSAHVIAVSERFCEIYREQRQVPIARLSLILKEDMIGKGAVIGAGSVVTHSVSAGMIVAGNLAKVIGKVSA